MKFTLKDYQTEAVADVIKNLHKAKKRWHEDTDTQAFSLTATTGAGKTVMAAAVFEALFYGEDDFDFEDLDDDFDMNVGTVSTGFTVDGLTFDNEEELRKKYPAPQDAWDHYKNVKHMCEQKEKENED